MVISLLLKLPFFSFSEGNVESWIAFWGSYVGALIGAITVYFVTNLQVREQRKLQLQAIKEEHENALKREMSQFHFKNEIEKIEEFDDTMEEIMDMITKSINDFTRYITYSHILYGGMDEYNKEEEVRLKEQIKELHTNIYIFIPSLNRLVLKMHRLSAYIDGTFPSVVEIQKKNDLFIQEIRKGYNNKFSFKDYPDFNSPPLNHYFEEYTRVIFELKANILQPKLNEKIFEMKRHSNLY
ncbi:hypothetical protein V1502_16975 [Bacillus sp. SCS-153A]|uniref:hypothetical protein n=1 Tax=Rossellomorea sedimentorum TaxID=3115294 RepID=UPI003905FC29